MLRYLKINDKDDIFYANLVIYGINYLLQVLFMIRHSPMNILSFLGLNWFGYPFFVKKNQSVKLSVIIVVEMLIDIYSAIASVYYIFIEQIIPRYISIPFFVTSVLPIPLFYEGTLYMPQQEILVKRYILLLLENSLTYLFLGVEFSMNYFHFIFVGGIWRILFLFEPFALWASLHTLVSPFRAICVSKGARSLSVIYLLHLEMFLNVYSTFFFMDQTLLNRVIAIIYLAYCVMFLVYEHVYPRFPFSHKIESVYKSASIESKSSAVL